MDTLLSNRKLTYHTQGELGFPGSLIGEKTQRCVVAWLQVNLDPA